MLDGLEVRVAFSGVWKESLTELSGGQRFVVGDMVCPDSKFHCLTGAIHHLSCYYGHHSQQDSC